VRKALKGPSSWEGRKACRPPSGKKKEQRKKTIQEGNKFLLEKGVLLPGEPQLNVLGGKGKRYFLHGIRSQVEREAPLQEEVSSAGRAKGRKKLISAVLKKGGVKVREESSSWMRRGEEYCLAEGKSRGSWGRERGIFCAGAGGGYLTAA